MKKYRVIIPKHFEKQCKARINPEITPKEIKKLIFMKLRNSPIYGEKGSLYLGIGESKAILDITETGEYKFITVLGPEMKIREAAQ